MRHLSLRVLVNSFESNSDVQAGSKIAALVSAVTGQGVTNGRQAVKITFRAGAEWPGVTWPAPPGSPWNWSATPGFAFDVTNPGQDAVDFSVRVNDSPKVVFAPKVVGTHTADARIEPGKTQTFFIDLANADDPMDHGMRGGPPTSAHAGFVSMGGVGQIDPSHIIKFQIFAHRPDNEESIIVDNIRVMPESSTGSANRYDAICDKYGQYTCADWPGKVHSDTDLIAAREAEKQSLAQKPTIANMDRFGGWATGPKQTASGFFRTINLAGKWWLVDPDGHLFLSFGPNCVSPEELTMITGRESMFVDMPKPTDPLGAFYADSHAVFRGPVRTGKVYNFYQANLLRKYGANYEAGWLLATLDRLKSWGFNTVGNWSSPDITSSHSIPYIGTLAAGFNKHAHVALPSGGWGPMHDPFDPAFATDCADRFKIAATPHKDDPWLLGYCVDNELSWGGGPADAQHYELAIGTLAGDETKSPAKQAFVDRLKSEYQTIDKLNSAWGTTLTSWDEMSAPYHAPKKFTPAMQQDFAAWITQYADQYFRVVRDELKKADPNHLYLGCRFAHFTTEEATVAAKYCDVVSFNIYQKGVDSPAYQFTKSLPAPCIVTEYHFGALDRGMFSPGLVAAPSTSERAQMFERYEKSVIDSPNFVGAHWFQYIDEPLTGRSFDGENYNIGFVSVTDTPYPEMVQAAREIHQKMYHERLIVPTLPQ